MMFKQGHDIGVMAERGRASLFLASPRSSLPLCARDGDRTVVCSVPTPTTPFPSRLSRSRLILFASGDFAFNLYWQSATVFLLFYYTEALGLPVGTAALLYALALVWDGIVNAAMGFHLDSRGGARDLSVYLLLGSVPLGAAFVLAYRSPMVAGTEALVAICLAHLLFRALYTVVNMPYLTMSARVSLRSDDRRLIAALRMLFGTAALVAVTLGTSRVGAWLAGNGATADAYVAAAAAFAALATFILIGVGAGVREVTAPRPAHHAQPRALAAALLRNRAFVMLNAAMAALIVAAGVFGKSVLYYYKYQLGDEAAGQAAVASMGLAGAVAVPAWAALSQRIGNRAAWLVAAAVAGLLLAGFGVLGITDADGMRAFLIAIQVALTGFYVVFWAMLPNTIEYGERATGLRAEGAVFGVASLLQRAAFGAAVAIFGTSLDRVGFVPNAAQPPAVLDALRWTMAGVPFAFVALSAGFMAMNPLRRHAHDEIVEELARRRAAAGVEYTP